MLNDNRWRHSSQNVKHAWEQVDNKNCVYVPGKKMVKKNYGWIHKILPAAFRHLSLTYVADSFESASHAYLSIYFSSSSTSIYYFDVIFLRCVFSSSSFSFFPALWFISWYYEKQISKSVCASMPFDFIAFSQPAILFPSISLLLAISHKNSWKMKRKRINFFFFFLVVDVCEWVSECATCIGRQSIKPIFLL